MAGKRQHYVPRFLQRGFLKDQEGPGEQTWLHRPSVKPKPVGIGDIGVEDWFYSRRSLDDTPTLDDMITELERNLAPRVGALRSSTPGSEIDAKEAAEVVVHLVMRTAHIRRTIADGMSALGDSLQALFSDPTRLRALVGLGGPELVANVSDMIRERALQETPAGIPVAFVERIVTFLLREHGDRLLGQAVASLGPFLPLLLNGLQERVRDTHSSLLQRHPQDNGRVVALSSLSWTVEANEDLILPDVIALAREADGPLVPLIFASNRNIATILMPIATDRMLVGCRANSDKPDLAKFNHEAVANCEAFFIGARPFDESVVSSLGSASANRIQDIVSNAISEAERARSDATTTITKAEPQLVTDKELSFSLSLADFGDEILAKEFAGVLRGVVGSVASDLPLHDLDGFTLAVDYQNALATLDRGDADMLQVNSEVLAYGGGVAKPVTVVRDGVYKEHLVIAAGLAEMWLSTDANLRATGLHMLVMMLAGVAHVTRYSSTAKTPFTLDAMKSELHSGVAAAPVNYWCARHAAFVSPDEGQAFADLVLTSLDFAERELAKERAAIPVDGDISSVTKRSLECVSAVLHHAADWLGHRDGLPVGTSFSGDDLSQRLKARGLDQWIELFGRDLAGCYGPDDALNLDTVVLLSSHVERVLWALGIYCWPEGGQVRCLVTDQSFHPSLLLS